MNNASYRFRCNDCSEEFDAVTSFDDNGQFGEVECPSCKSGAKTLIGLSVEAAEEIARSETNILDLSSLVELPDDVAAALAEHRGFHGWWGGLMLDGIHSLSVDAAKALAKWRGEHLRLNGLRTISTKVAEALAGWDGDHRARRSEGQRVPTLEHLELNGLKCLSDEAARALARWGDRPNYMRSKLSLRGLTELSIEAAKALAHSKALELEIRLPHWDAPTAGSLLLTAVSQECEPIVEELLNPLRLPQHYVNERNSDGDTSLHIAAAYVVKNPEWIPDEEDEWFYRFHAERQEHIFKLLLSCDECDPNCRNTEGNTPMHILAANEEHELAPHWMAILLEHGASNVPNADGN